jgi:hypothetical protein
MSEQTRIEMLCARDGKNAAKEWAQSAFQLYHRSIANPVNFASQTDLNVRFEQSMRELATFVERGTLDAQEVVRDGDTSVDGAGSGEGFGERTNTARALECTRWPGYRQAMGAVNREPLSTSHRQSWAFGLTVGMKTTL